MAYGRRCGSIAAHFIRGDAMKHPEILQKLSLEQKCALLSGKNTWQTQDYPKQGVPAIWLSDLSLIHI